jgi:hypothetical protein
MTDYCLRFPDEATSFAAAQELGAVIETEDGPRLARFTERYAIDVIGEIALPPETEGGEPTPLTGWHVNLRIIDGSPLPEELAPFVVTPTNPYRVWA